MSGFVLGKKGDKVVKVLEVMGIRTATVDNVIEKVSKGVITIKGSTAKFNAATGNEIDPPIPGCRSYLVALDG